MTHQSTYKPTHSCCERITLQTRIEAGGAHLLRRGPTRCLRSDRMQRRSQTDRHTHAQIHTSTAAQQSRHACEAIQHTARALLCLRPGERKQKQQTPKFLSLSSLLLVSNLEDTAFLHISHPAYCVPPSSTTLPLSVCLSVQAASVCDSVSVFFIICTRMHAFSLHR